MRLPASIRLWLLIMTDFTSDEIDQLNEFEIRYTLKNNAYGGAL